MSDRVYPIRRPSVDSFLRNSIRRKKKVKFDLATVSFQVDYPTKPKRKGWVEVVPENVAWCDEVWARLAQNASSQNSSQNSHEKSAKPKENLVLYCLKQLAVWQWAKLLLSLLCFIQFALVFWRLYTLFQKNHIHSSLRTLNDESIELPAFTLCLPVIIAFQNNCVNSKQPGGSVEPESNSATFQRPQSANISGTPSLTRECKSQLLVSALFNQSLSEFGHQCRVRQSLLGKDSLNNYRLLDCSSISKPIETFYQNERCFTYLSEVAAFRQHLPQQSSITILIHSNRVDSFERAGSGMKPRIFVHSSRELIFGKKYHSSGIDLELNRRYKIAYHYLMTVQQDWQSFFNCQNYSKRSMFKESTSEGSSMNHISRQQCLDECMIEQNPCPNCFSTRSPIRKDLAEITDQLCLAQSCPNETEMMQNIAQTCQHHCPVDCEATDFETTVKLDKTPENAELDLASLNTIQIQIVPDKEKESLKLEQFPLLDRDSFIAQLGGAVAFWFAIAWLACWIVGFLEFIYELVQIYKH